VIAKFIEEKGESRRSLTKREEMIKRGLSSLLGLGEGKEGGEADPASEVSICPVVKIGEEANSYSARGDAMVGTFQKKG